MMDLPPPFPPHVMQCASIAAQEYQVPRVLLLAIIKTESGGNVRSVNKNRNGTKDVGLMQINTTWSQRLRSQYGIPDAHEQLVNNPCYNVRVGAWVLKNELSSNQNIPYWQRVGNYNSRTPRHNAAYRNRVYQNMVWIINNTAWQV